MDQTTLQNLLPPVQKIARDAGQEIMRFYHAGTTVRIKDDGDPVTEADDAAEKIILAGLRALTPEIPILSEERASAGDIPDISKGTFWTVDPLDGTNEFRNKTGNFVVAVSLFVDYKPVLGVIYYPVQNMLCSGAGPGTASKIGGESLLPGAKNPSVLINEKSVDLEAVRQYLIQQFGKASYKTDNRGTSLRACDIAFGSGDDMTVVLPKRRNGRTKLWDVAPGHAIIEAAGGKVLGLDGQPLVYNAEDLQVAAHIMT